MLSLGSDPTLGLASGCSGHGWSNHPKVYNINRKPEARAFRNAKIMIKWIEILLIIAWGSLGVGLGDEPLFSCPTSILLYTYHAPL